MQDSLRCSPLNVFLTSSLCVNSAHHRAQLKIQGEQDEVWVDAIAHSFAADLLVLAPALPAKN